MKLNLDLKSDKKWTDGDIDNAIMYGYQTCMRGGNIDKDKYIQSLNQKTEKTIDFVDWWNNLSYERSQKLLKLSRPEVVKIYNEEQNALKIKNENNR